MAITWYRFEVGVSPDVCGWVWDALLKHRVQVKPTVAIVFKGSPIPNLKHVNDYVEITWNDRVEVEIEGLPDPTIKYIRVFKDHAMIYLAAGNVRADFVPPKEDTDDGILYRSV